MPVVFCVYFLKLLVSLLLDMSSMEQERRLAALCKRMGHLWRGRKIAELDNIVTAEKINECERTLLGRLYGRPSINFQAFQATMKQAWKVDSVICKHLEPGLFSFEFQNLENRNHILETGPWSFSGHLLVLKPWEPNTPPQCINFDFCYFWVHIHGLPIEGRSLEAIRNVAENIGVVSEVKMESKGAAAIIVGKAKVLLKLSSPLESGMTARFKGQEHWLDFRYERLPRYCYSCGKIGHFAQQCESVPYDESLFTTNGNILFGS